MRNDKWEESEIIFLKNNYKEMTNKQLSKKLDRTKTAVDLKLNRLGLKKSRYVYNKDFFEIINTEEKAYWLGFIYADGCIAYNKKLNNGELVLKLQWGDYKHLQKFNKSINGNIEVKKVVEELNGKNYLQCHLRVYSYKMVLDLIKHGVYINKTKILHFPKDIDNNLMNHFIRGYFDGDGCVSKDSAKKKTIGANFTSGSLSFLEDLRSFLYLYNINSYIYQERKNTYRLYIKGLKNYNTFFNYLYKNSTIYLERKLKKKNDIYQEYDIAQRLLL